MSQNIFVLGLDDLNLRMLREIPRLEQYRFHGLLTIGELQQGDIDFAELLERARERLDAFEGEVDAIIGFWDFPITSMVPILCARYGLPGPSLESIVKCEHKYWSRIEQREVIEEYPPFGLVDLSPEGRAEPPPGVRYPMWLKPVKSTSSELAFLARDDAEFDRAVADIRAGIGRIGEPFQEVMNHLDLPPEIAEIGGVACLAEESIDGAQVTVEGYSHEGEVHVYGIVDSVDYPDMPSFQRYQYPSSVPGDVAERMTDISVRVIRRLGLDSTTFNIEYFWNRDDGRITLLEVNPRHSQSHAPLFEYVDGTPNHEAMVRLALGHRPEIPKGAGEYDIAAKWFVRHREDALVRRVPSEAEIKAVERDVPGTIVEISVAAGQRLSDISMQDSYSYEVARVFMGARDEAELKAKYEKAVAGLPFEFEPPKGT
ncbi:acetyl-CoA carboxylase biotin carboxylase subunit family protein [Actinomadura sp. LOL_016]|uniref:ATP-grasp domain-containing protein n=1 Tax=unclassified Actinomadura TaxID=2626254 RepID=UPI003A8051B5